MPTAILSSVKSTVNLCFPFMLTSKMDTHTHMQMHNPSHFWAKHTQTHTHTRAHTHAHTRTHTHLQSHPFSSPSDELLSCLLDIGSMQPQSHPAANHRTMRRTSSSPACSAFAGGHFSIRPSEILGGDWLGGARWVRHQWKQKRAGKEERGDTLTFVSAFTITS